MWHNFINLSNITNILPYLCGITHLITETTSYKRKCGKEIGNIRGQRRREYYNLFYLFQTLADEGEERGQRLVRDIVILPHLRDVIVRLSPDTSGREENCLCLRPRDLSPGC